MNFASPLLCFQQGFVVLLWVTWILTYFAYLSVNDDTDGVLSLARLNCDHSQFGCAILQGITNWLTIMVQLSIVGTVFIVWASLGNSVYPTHPLLSVAGMCAPILFVFLPYAEEFDGMVISTKKDPGVQNELIYNLSLTCGIFLLCFYMVNIAQRILPHIASHSIAKRILTPGIVRLEFKTKRSASFKTNRLVRNACKIHTAADFDGNANDGETKYGKAMLAYARSADQNEEFGGFLHIWKQILSGDIFEEEGLWLTTHLLAGNLAQCTIVLLLGSIFIQFYRSDLFQEGLLHLEKLGAKSWRLILPLFFGVICGEITIIIITANYIPSMMRTILRYRSGGLDSLHSKKFQKLRIAVDNSTLLFGYVYIHK